MNDREFDLLLQDTLEKPPAYASDFNPWRKAMTQVLWGWGLRTLTFNFFGLDLVLPGLGTILMVLGFRTLRDENGWFRFAYWASLLHLLWWLANYFLGISPWHEVPWIQDARLLLSYGMLPISFCLLLSLRNGVRAVQRKAGLPCYGGIWMLLWYTLMVLLALIRFDSILILLLLAAYIGILRGLWMLTKELDQAGYAITASPLRLSNRTLSLGFLGCVLLVTVLGYTVGSKYPMSWEPFTAASASDVLLELGFPEDILADLTQEEIAALEGADLVSVKPQEAFDGALKITIVGVHFDEGQERWCILQHFRWAEDRDFLGTEALQIQPPSQRTGWNPLGDCRGRVLCERHGETLASPYHHLGAIRYTSSSPVLFGDANRSEIFATFSLPSGAENVRGYVMYDVLQNREDAVASTVLTYAHQHSLLQFPVQTALEFRMRGYRMKDHAFESELSYTSFFLEH